MRIKKLLKARTIIFIALLFRLIVLIPILNSPEQSLKNDSVLYLSLGENILNGNGFTSCKEAPFYPDVIRTPVYPTFIALVCFFFGESLEWLVLLQVLIDILTSFLIYKIGTNFFNNKIGFVSGAFYAIGITFVGLSGQVISETLFTFLVTLTLYFLSVYSSKAKWPFLFSFFICWALSVYTKPVALFTFPFLGFVVIYAKGLNWKLKFIQAVFFMMIGLALIYPWLQRNKNITGIYTMSIVIEHDLYAYNMAYLKSYLEGRDEQSVVKELLSPYGQQKGSIPSCYENFAYLKEFKAISTEYITDNMGTYLFLHLKSIWHNLIPGVTDILKIYGVTSGGKGTVEILNHEGLLAAVSHYFDGNQKVIIPLIPWLFCWGVYLLSAIYGIIILAKRKLFIMFWLLLLWGGYYIMVPGPMSAPRFFAPAAPFFCLLAGVGFSSFTLFSKYLKYRFA